MSRKHLEHAHKSVSLKKAVKKASKISNHAIKQLQSIPAVADKLNRLAKASTQAQEIINWQLELGKETAQETTVQVRGVATYDRRNQDQTFPVHDDPEQTIIFKACTQGQTPSEGWKQQATSDGRVWVEDGKTYVELEVPVNKKFFIWGWDKQQEIEANSPTKVAQADRELGDIPVVFHDDVQGDVSRAKDKLQDKWLQTRAWLENTQESLAERIQKLRDRYEGSASDLMIKSALNDNASKLYEQLNALNTKFKQALNNSRADKAEQLYTSAKEKAKELRDWLDIEERINTLGEQLASLASWYAQNQQPGSAESLQTDYGVLRKKYEDAQSLKDLKRVTQALEESIKDIAQWYAQNQQTGYAEQLQNEYGTLRQAAQKSQTLEEFKDVLDNMISFVQDKADRVKQWARRETGGEETTEEPETPSVVITPAEGTTKKPTFHVIKGNMASMVDDLKENTLAFDVHRDGGKGSWYYTYDIRFSYTTTNGQSRWLTADQTQELGISFSGMKTLNGGQEEIQAEHTGMQAADSDEVTRVDEQGGSFAIYETERIYAAKGGKKTIRISFGDDKKLAKAQKLILKQEGAFGVLQDDIGEQISAISVYVRAALAQGTPDINSPAANATIHIYNPALNPEGS